jgi:DNA-binding transcriptional regulator YiaG
MRPLREETRQSEPPVFEEHLCPACGGDSLETQNTQATFTYGDGPGAVELRYVLPLRMCKACGFEFTDCEAEAARDLAVRKHLGVFLPAEIQGLRASYGLSRHKFGSLTKIGAASLARWESGEIIQNPGYDQFLYLLTFPENMARLESRYSTPSQRASNVRSIDKLTVRFPSLPDPAKTAARSQDFHLRGCRVA